MYLLGEKKVDPTFTLTFLLFYPIFYFLKNNKRLFRPIKKANRMGIFGREDFSLEPNKKKSC